MTSRLRFIASKSRIATQRRMELIEQYGDWPLEEADSLVVLGGDGFLLHCLHQYAGHGLGFYGMNLGTVGFLLNNFDRDNLRERIAAARSNDISPLMGTVTLANGSVRQVQAFNEIAILREKSQSSHIRISLDGTTTLNELVCDGVMVSTAAGSTAYNYSAHGPILPIDSKLLALTPICAYSPRRWPGALIPNSAEVNFEVLTHKARPVSVTADNSRIANIASVKISYNPNVTATLLFDADRDLSNRIIKEQFQS